MRLPALKHRVKAVHALGQSQRVCVLGSSALMGSFPDLGEESGLLELSFDADLLVAKLRAGRAKDLDPCRAFLQRGLVAPAALRARFDETPLDENEIVTVYRRLSQVQP